MDSEAADTFNFFVSLHYDPKPVKENYFIIRTTSSSNRYLCKADGLWIIGEKKHAYRFESRSDALRYLLYAGEYSVINEFRE